MADLKKFPVKLAFEQENGKFYVYGSHIVNFDEITDKIDETNELLTAANASLVDANGHLVDINGNLVEIDGELVDINTVEGTVTDAAVTGDVNGTISAKLRGITTQMALLLINEASQLDVQGTITDAAVTGDANGTISAKLRGLTTQMVSLLAKQDSQISVQGATNDAAVTGDSNGTISAKLRGLTTQMVSLLTKQDSQISVQGATTDAAVTGDADGSISAKLRGITTQMVTLLASQASQLDVQGATTDAAVTAGSAGTVSGKLRQISADIATGNTNQTNGTQQTKITDGTNVAHILKSDGTVVGENAQLVAPAVRVIPFTTSTPGAQTILDNIDVTHYNYIEIVYTSVGSGLNVSGQFSATNSGTYVSGLTFNTGSALSIGTLGSTINTVYATPTRGNFFRLLVTALTSGTFAGTVTLRSIPPALHIANVHGDIGSRTATGSAFPTNAFAQGVKALTSSPTAATTNSLTPLSADVMGEALVTTGGLVTNSVPANASNVVVKATAGRLCRVLVTATGVTPLVIHDNATTNAGTIIGALPANAPVGSVYDFEMPAANGITIAGSAANPDVTISFI